MSQDTIRLHLNTLDGKAYDEVLSGDITQNQCTFLNYLKYQEIYLFH